MRSSFLIRSAVAAFAVVGGASVLAQQASPGQLPLLPPSAPAAANIGAAVSTPPPPPPVATSALPSVNMPAAPAVQAPGAPANAALPAVEHATAVPQQNSAPAATDDSYYSFGRSDLSLLFLPAQIEKMKIVLRTYEDQRRNGTVAAEPLDVSITSSAVTEPKTYPVFYLSSIAYRSARDWTVWVSGHKITPQKNTTDLTVIGISPHMVTLAWRPTYADAIHTRLQRHLFASSDPVKHRLVRPAAYRYDDAAGYLTFRLRPNQSFAVGYFDMFEGYIDSPALPPTDDKSAAGVVVAPTAPPPSAAPVDAKPKQGGLAQDEIDRMVKSTPSSRFDAKSLQGNAP